MSFLSSLVSVLTTDDMLAVELKLAVGAVTAMVAVGLRFSKQRLNLLAGSTAAQLENTANITIQTAVGNFAARVNEGIAAGTMTRQSALPQLTQYLEASVSGSMALLKPGAVQLATILNNKLAQIVASGLPLVSVPVPAVEPPAPPAPPAVGPASIVEVL